MRGVDDRTPSKVVARALRNHLAGDGDQLVAELAPGATVSLPDHELRLTGIETLQWNRDGATVIAVATARGGGEQWTLRYELDLAQHAGRWEISAIERAVPPRNGRCARP